jgi:hypothetical protein
MVKKTKAVSRKSRPRAGPRASLSQASIREGLGILDPFSNAAKTAKYPDGSSRATLVAQLVEETPVIADDEGEFAICQYAGAPATGLGGATSVVDGVVTWAGAGVPTQYASLAAIAQYGRVVSAGMYYIPTAATDSNGGRVYVSNQLDRPVNITECQNEKIFAAKDPIFIAALPLGSLARQFVAIANTDAFDWTQPTMIFQGLTGGATVGYVRRVFNIEYTPLLGSIAQQLGATLKPHNPHLMSGLVDAYQMEHIVSGTDGYVNWINSLAAALGGASIALGGVRLVNQTMLRRMAQGYQPFSGN